MAPLELRTPSGLRLAADQTPPQPGRPTWVYLHGLASVRIGEKSLALKERAARHGCGWLTYDQPGHGDSDGELNHTSLGDLVEAAHTVLQSTGPAVVFGSSLGGLVSAWTAARHPDSVRALILLSPAFGFLAQLASGGLRSVVAGTQGEVTFSPRALADADQFDEAVLPGLIRAPTLICHGEQDEVVPWQASQSFCEGLTSAATGWADGTESVGPLWILPGEDHRLNQPIQEVLDASEGLLRAAGTL